MAFPGGRREPADATILAALRREVAEEVGIELDGAAALLGALDEVEPVSVRLPPLVIAPFAFAVGAGVTAVPDRQEVQATVWISIDALRDPGGAAEITYRGHPFPAIRWGSHVIWGLTYRILQDFLPLAGEAGI